MSRKIVERRSGVLSGRGAGLNGKSLAQGRVQPFIFPVFGRAHIDLCYRDEKLEPYFPDRCVKAECAMTFSRTTFSLFTILFAAACQPAFAQHPVGSEWPCGACGGGQAPAISISSLSPAIIGSLGWPTRAAATVPQSLRASAAALAVCRRGLRRHAGGRAPVWTWSSYRDYACGDAGAVKLNEWGAAILRGKSDAA